MKPTANGLLFDIKLQLLSAPSSLTFHQIFSAVTKAGTDVTYTQLHVALELLVLTDEVVTNTSPRYFVANAIFRVKNGETHMTPEEDDYAPTEHDLDWMKTVLLMVTQGGTLVYPDALVVYTVTHHDKTLTLSNPQVLSDPRAQQLHRRTIVVAKALGYQVLVKEE